MIEQAISNYFSTLWAAYYEPFYLYCLIGFVLVVGATWIAWFFDILRPLAGALSLGVLAFLAGFWKGEKAARVQEEARRQRDDR